MEWFKKLRPGNQGDIHSALTKTSTEAEAVLPLLDEKDGGRAEQRKFEGKKALQDVRLPLLSVAIFILSCFSTYSASTAATDSACEKKMWPASMQTSLEYLNMANTTPKVRNAALWGSSSVSTTPMWFPGSISDYPPPSAASLGIDPGKVGQFNHPDIVTNLMQAEMVAGYFPFPISNFALVNKTTDPLNWWRLPPPRHDEALVTSDGAYPMSLPTSYL